MPELRKSGRLFLIVLDSVGIGALPDAAEYGDADAATLQHVSDACDGLNLPNLEGMGLGRLGAISGVDPLACRRGASGVMAERSAGKDTITGHWEMMGLILEKPFRTYPNGFPSALIDVFSRRIGRGVLGNIAASGTEIIKQLGEEHVRTGYPIVYTSADSVFQIAAHEEVVPLEQLYDFCRIARELCSGDYNVARIIARPFRGGPGTWFRTEGRRDFAVEPPGTFLHEDIVTAGIPVIGVGKIEDIFLGRGVTSSHHTGSNAEGMATILSVTPRERCFVFVNLVDFDMKFGHRLDAVGYGAALEAFDAWLPSLLNSMTAEDLLLITADHGCDPTTPGTDHSREYVPIICWSHSISECRNLGRRQSFADVGQTVVDFFQCKAPQRGQSFLALLT